MSSLTAVSIRVAQGVGIVLVVAIVALGLHYRSATRSLVLQEGESAEFLIPKGSSWDAIVERLESAYRGD